MPITNPTTFNTYINSLQPWDKELLTNIQPFDHQILIQMLKDDELFFLCSDGGAKDLIGSFRAILANGTNMIVELSGQAYRQQPCSF